jgi:hypothetical protein
MLSVAKLTLGQEAYYEQQVARGLDDYYAGRGESPGLWAGRGADELGLIGVVGDGDLGRLLRGINPADQARLRSPDHATCLEALDWLTLPLVTTWPAFTEAMYLLGRAGEITGQRALWRLVHTDRLVVADLSRAAVERSARLMEQYADRPMDLADATLVAFAEEQGHRTIFTLDADFHVYRLRGRQRFQTIPPR